MFKFAISCVAATAALLAITQAGTAQDTGKWPQFYGQVGADSVLEGDELRQMAQSGFHFALLNFRVSQLPEVVQYNIRYLDLNPQFFIYRLCHRDFAASGACSRETQDEVLQHVGQYLDQHAQDRQLIGYWLLDDDPGGDVRPLMRQVHDLIAQHYRQGQMRPTVCAFNRVQALENFDPHACDMVAIYLYSRNRRGQWGGIDWSLSERLPELLSALRAAGWNQDQTPLIGMPQAFGNVEGKNFVMPSAADVADQSEAYCRAGAIALLAYTWHDKFGDSASEMFNTPSLVDGLKRGAENCRTRYWSR